MKKKRAHVSYGKKSGRKRHPLLAGVRVFNDSRGSVKVGLVQGVGSSLRAGSRAHSAAAEAIGQAIADSLDPNKAAGPVMQIFHREPDPAAVGPDVEVTARVMKRTARGILLRVSGRAAWVGAAICKDWKQTATPDVFRVSVPAFVARRARWISASAATP